MVGADSARKGIAEEEDSEWEYEYHETETEVGLTIRNHFTPADI